MARADLISDLVAFGMTGDRARFRKAVEALIAEERAMKHTVLAEKLAELIQFTAQETPRINGSVGIEQKSIGFVHEIIPKRRLDDLVLSKDILDIVREVVSEHHRADLLRSYNLEPRNRFLLIGPRKRQDFVG